MVRFAVELVGSCVFQPRRQIFPDDVALFEEISFHHFLVALQVQTIATKDIVLADEVHLEQVLPEVLSVLQNLRYSFGTGAFQWLQTLLVLLYRSASVPERVPVSYDNEVVLPVELDDIPGR